MKGRRGLTRHGQNPTQQSQAVRGEDRGWNKNEGGGKTKQNNRSKREKGGESERRRWMRSAAVSELHDCPPPSPLLPLLLWLLSAAALRQGVGNERSYSLSPSLPLTALLPVPSLEWDALTSPFAFLPGRSALRYPDTELSVWGCCRLVSPPSRSLPRSFPLPCRGWNATPVCLCWGGRSLNALLSHAWMCGAARISPGPSLHACLAPMGCVCVCECVLFVLSCKLPGQHLMRDRKWVKPAKTFGAGSDTGMT